MKNSLLNSSQTFGLMHNIGHYPKNFPNIITIERDTILTQGIREEDFS